jgi:recombination protein RecT
MPTPNLPAAIAAVESRLPELKQLLPADVPIATFFAHFKTAAMQTQGLLDCTPRSVVLACVRAANDGLVVDGREAVIIVRNQKQKDGSWQRVAVYQRMYSGTLKRVRAALPGCSVEARLVFQADAFKIAFGDSPSIEHTPTYGIERGAFLGCYAIVTEKNGMKHRDWMEAEEIDAIRNRSQGYNPEKPAGPWASDYGEMCKKTVLNRLAKLLPQAQGRPAIAADADDHGGATDEVEIFDATTVPLPELEATVAEAEKPAVKQGTIADVPGGTITSGKPPFKRSTVDAPEEPAKVNGQSEVQLWKMRLRELRDAIAPVLTKLSVEDAWTEWNEKYSPPDEVVTAAKGLIDKRLGEMEAAAKAYEEAKG